MNKIYPRFMPWDYVASSRESRELERLINLREAIAQSKKEFEAGKKILLEDKFFNRINHYSKQR